MSIIFLGESPSKRNTDPKRAFVGSGCWPRLLGWMRYMDLHPDEVLLHNSNNAEGLRLAVEVAKAGGKVVAVGNVASIRLTRMKVKHFKLSHPSGLNRQVNNKEYVDNMLKACYNYLRDE